MKKEKKIPERSRSGLGRFYCISCNLYGQSVHGADRTKLSGRPPTCRRDAGEPLDKHPGLVSTAGAHSSSM